MNQSTRTPTPEQMSALASAIVAIAPLDEELEAAAAALNSAAAEIPRLRAVIANAPHRFDCQKRMTGVHLRMDGLPDPCNCWKEGAL